METDTTPTQPLGSNSRNGSTTGQENKPSLKISNETFLIYGIPPRYLDSKLADLQTTDSNREFLKEANSQAELFFKHTVPEKGIFVYGTPGTGKSTANYCIAKAVIHSMIKQRGWLGEEDYRRYGGNKTPFTVKIIKFRDLLQGIITGYKQGKDFVGEICSVNYLFIDDMTVRGLSRNSDSIYRWADEAMNQIIDNFWDKEPKTCGLYITSNNSATELAEVFGDPFMDRVRGLSLGFELEGSSFR